MPKFDESIEKQLDQPDTDSTTDTKIIDAEYTAAEDDSTSSMCVVDDMERQLAGIRNELDRGEAVDDYIYIRNKLKNLMDAGGEALDGALLVAIATDSPRAYEVVGGLIKNLSEATEKMMKLQKDIREIQNSENSGPGNKIPGDVINNNLFVGSTSELLTLIDKQRKSTDG